ncbi:MAG: AsnC family protein [Candidatus Freyarchaeota archaeon]|nr:AsnC family protein [Candidatus Jordarchaeia archaeon]
MENAVTVVCDIKYISLNWILNTCGEEVGGVMASCSNKSRKGRREEVRQRLLFELIKCSRRSDKELSKVIGCTRATVYRRRKELEREIN